MGLEDFAPSYGSFRSLILGRAPGHPTMDITIARPPETPMARDGEEQVFVCGEGWTLFKNSRHYRFVLPLSASENPFCTIVATHDFTDVVLYYWRDPVPFCYPVDQILLMHILALNEGAIVHSAGIEYNGASYIFPGVSGAGKSTLSRLLPGAAGLEVLSDDRMIVRKIGDGFRAYGTPWPGDAGFAANGSAPLKGIFFLTKASECRIDRLTPMEALKRFLPVASIPWYDKGMVSNMLDFCDGMLRHVPAYDLRFTPHGGVADMLLAHMNQ